MVSENQMYFSSASTQPSHPLPRNYCFLSPSPSNHQHPPLLSQLMTWIPTSLRNASNQKKTPTTIKSHLPVLVPINFSFLPGNVEEPVVVFPPNANPSTCDLDGILSRLLKDMALATAVCLSCILNFPLLVHFHKQSNMLSFLIP